MNVLFGVFLALAAEAAVGDRVCRDCVPVLSDSADHEVIVDRVMSQRVSQCRGLF
jgi:hypothetical protein